MSTSTENGYDPAWVSAINAVLNDREVDVQITDLDDEFWDRWIGPAVDEIADGGTLVDYRITKRVVSTTTRAEVKAALEGDSNDREHSALAAVAGELGIEWDPELAS
jgi:hypothetical protein